MHLRHCRGHRRATSCLLVGAALGLLSACGGSTIDATAPPTESAAGATPLASSRTFSPVSASPNLSPTPIASAPADLTWTREGFPGQVDAVGVDDGRFVAVGRDEVGLAAWTSPDGIKWERHHVPDPSFVDYPPYEAEPDSLPNPPSGSGMGPIFRLGDTLFSFGIFSGFNDFYRPIAWRSPDGETWEFVESDSEFFSYGAATDFAISGGTIVAAHATGLIGPIYSVWRWTAATSWQITGLSSTMEQSLDIADLTWTGAQFVAVGAMLDPTEASQEEWPQTPAAWTSTDGEAWDPLALPDDLARSCATLAAEDGLIVVGETQAGTVAAWTRTAGDDWERSDIGDSPAPGGCWGYAADSANGLSVVATAAPDGPELWISRDGVRWSRSETEGVVAFDDGIAVLGDIVVVFGSPAGEGSQTETLLLRGASP